MCVCVCVCVCVREKDVLHKAIFFSFMNSFDAPVLKFSDHKIPHVTKCQVPALTWRTSLLNVRFHSHQEIKSSS